jgi:hypothetical protein
MTLLLGNGQKNEFRFGRDDKGEGGASPQI